MEQMADLADREEEKMEEKKTGFFGNIFGGSKAEAKPSAPKSKKRTQINDKLSVGLYKAQAKQSKKMW